MQLKRPVCNCPATTFDSEPRNYVPFHPFLVGRTSVSQPIDPYIHVKLIGNYGENAEMRLSDQQALELIQGLLKCMADKFKRGDIRDALRRTEGGRLT